MNIFKRMIYTTAILVVCTPAGESLAESEINLRTPESFQHDGRFIRTPCEIIGFNVIMTTYGRLIMAPDSDGFRVSLHTIEENLKAGMEWDDNSFSANNFRHPYQGGVYFNAARANGFDFYESSVGTFAGAWLFEYTGEAHHASFNDWMNTSLGGIFLGETLWRFSSMIYDNTARGSDRVAREVGGFLANPVRGLNRLITGEAYNVHANPPGRMPPDFQGRFRAGIRTIGKESLWNLPNTKAFISMDFSHGSVHKDISEPFDYFDFSFQLTFDNNPYAIEYITGNALLKSWESYGEGSTVHTFGAFMHMDYVENEAYTFGGQSLSAAYKVRFFKKKRVEATLKGHLEGILLGAAKSDYFNLSGREYDYGPGLGARVGLSLLSGGRPFLSFDYRTSWIKSINGTIADHIMHYGLVRADAPLFDFVGMGLEYSLYYVDRRYLNYPDVSTRNPRLKVYLTWNAY